MEEAKIDSVYVPAAYIASEKQAHVPAAYIASEKQAHVPAANSASEKQAHVEVGLWGTLAEFARATHNHKKTLRRWIGEGLLLNLVRKSLKLSGQKGSGYEIYITDEKTIEAIKHLRLIRAAGIKRRGERVPLKDTKQHVRIQVPSEIYLAGTSLVESGKMAFSDYLKIALNLGKTMVHRQRQINVRVEKEDHVAVSNLAKETGRNISDTYRIFYEHYIANIYNTNHNINPKKEARP